MWEADPGGNERDEGEKCTIVNGGDVKLVEGSLAGGDVHEENQGNV